jgi:hypothetical protein
MISRLKRKILSSVGCVCNGWTHFLDAVEDYYYYTSVINKIGCVTNNGMGRHFPLAPGGGKRITVLVLPAVLVFIIIILVNMLRLKIKQRVLPRK